MDDLTFLVNLYIIFGNQTLFLTVMPRTR